MSETLTCKNCGTHFLNHRKRPDGTPKHLCSRCVEKFNQIKAATAVHLPLTRPVQPDRAGMVETGNLTDKRYPQTVDSLTDESAIRPNYDEDRLQMPLPVQQININFNHPTSEPKQPGVVAQVIGVGLTLSVMAFCCWPFWMMSRSIKVQPFFRLGPHRTPADIYVPPMAAEAINSASRDEAKSKSDGRPIVWSMWMESIPLEWPNERLRTVHVLESPDPWKSDAIEVWVTFNHETNAVTTETGFASRKTWVAPVDAYIDLRNRLHNTDDSR